MRFRRIMDDHILLVLYGLSLKHRMFISYPDQHVLQILLRKKTMTLKRLASHHTPLTIDAVALCCSCFSTYTYACHSIFHSIPRRIKVTMAARDGYSGYLYFQIS
ncbi:hypothetical protein TNCV_446081 [Trichonephila clavipes]|nr:hypothetical protein TNCV_446081 [Trichonephila clavipes]